ncbi:MAG: sugar phosphate nucleotidyltransferase [[Clostridium] aminophilum]|uniref:nucleotidyltransferase family protein n=1 Tax=[Clostridium] aminophilum TaxID=1526 RepID=UPI0026EAFC6E|nr:sugar phosphate nucleotidyltransferase [[Clostridium] aminophilum]MDD6196203.1 sugar phosphate nucleotidyltransferase [[Clostridium] aminophilum]
MKTSLVIMAAGIGSRFGGGVKQLSPVGPNGEIIMDYSIHDAIQAGFNKIIFILRPDIEEDFMEVIGNRIEKICSESGVEVDYAFQMLKNIPMGYEIPEGRTKPWGTGLAVLSCRAMVHEPFCVINADDYYGKGAFQAVHDYLVNYDPSRPMDFCMAGFILGNTLSDHGSVTRGLCKVDEDGNLTEVVETHDILKTADGAEADGKKLDVKSHVSMNFWGFTPEYFKILEKGYKAFWEDIAAGKSDPLKAEYLIPIHIGDLLKKKAVSVKVLETKDKWFGVTYKEDQPVVAEAFRKLIADGVYHENLFEDLK